MGSIPTAATLSGFCFADCNASPKFEFTIREIIKRTNINKTKQMLKKLNPSIVFKPGKLFLK